MTNYHLTIVVVTADRAELFQRNLESLFFASADCSDFKYQIRIVLNRPDAKTIDYVNGIDRKDVKIFTSKVRLFPGAARNLALQGIVSDWIYFIDDDAFVDKNFFSKALLFIKENDCSFIGGPNVSPLNGSVFSNVTQLTLENPYICFEISKRYTRDQGITALAIEESMILCNFFLKSDCLEFFKGGAVFEDHLAGGEENCLVQKLTALQKNGLFVSDLFIWHERRKSIVGFCQQMYKYGYGRGLLDNQWGKFEIRHAALLVLIVILIFLILRQIPRLVFLYFLYCTLAVSLRALKRPDRFQFAVWMLIPFLHIFYILGILGGTINGFKLHEHKFSFRISK